MELVGVRFLLLAPKRILIKTLNIMYVKFLSVLVLTQHLLGTTCRPGTELGAEDTIASQTDKVPDFMEINSFKDKTVTN